METLLKVPSRKAIIQERENFIGRILKYFIREIFKGTQSMEKASLFTLMAVIIEVL